MLKAIGKRPVQPTEARHAGLALRFDAASEKLPTPIRVDAHAYNYRLQIYDHVLRICGYHMVPVVADEV